MPAHLPTPPVRSGRSALSWPLAAAALCAAALVVFVLVGGLLFSAALSAPEQSAWQQMVDERWPLLLLPGLALVACAAAGGSLLHRRWAAAPAQLAEQASMVLGAGGPQLQPHPAWPAELLHLAHSVQTLVAQREHLRADMAREVAHASRRIEQERNRLAALMSELSQSVVVCNLDGRILLYNRRARLQFRVLGSALPDLCGAEVIGLGRSIYTVLEREPLAQGLARLQARLRRGAEHPTVEFTSPAPGGHVVRVQMAPVRTVEHSPPGLAEAGGAQPSEPSASGDEAMNGFVLLLENVTPRPEGLSGHGPGAEAGSGSGAEPEPEPEPPSGLGRRAAGVAGAARLESVGDAASRSDSRPVFYDFDLFAHRDTGQALEDRPLASLSFTVFDTETTGLDPGGGDEIIQIGAVRLVNGRLLPDERFEQLIDPRRPVPAASVPFHGLTSAQLRGQPTIEQVLPVFHRFAQDTVLVAHNAAFDMRFLQEKQALTGLRFDQPVLDTLLLSAVLHPHQESHRLEAIAQRMGVTVFGRHTAMGDAVVTAELFLRLLPLLADQGIHTLGQALAAAQKSRYASLRY
jgi:DNA polymerase III epsilon subunit family exonuclease